MRRRTLLRLLLPAVAAALLPASRADAGHGGVAGPSAAVVFDIGGKMDKSFLQLGFQGVLQVRRDGAANLVEYEVAAAARRLSTLLKAAEENTFVIAIGSGLTEAVAQVARERPNRRFVLIDGDVELPNVAAITFADQEAAFLAGAMAGLATETGIAGFVGGVDVPPIRRFRAGFRQGFLHTRPDGRLLTTILGTDSDAWDDPFRALLVAREQLAEGADVLFAACGASGLGVYQAAADAGRLAIGVDANQNYLHPSTMLTSAVKRVDRAVLVAVRMLRGDQWRPGRTVLGLKEDAVGVAFDDHNAALTAPMRAAVDDIRRDIIAGTLAVATD